MMNVYMCLIPFQEDTHPIHTPCHSIPYSSGLPLHTNSQISHDAPLHQSPAGVSVRHFLQQLMALLYYITHKTLSQRLTKINQNFFRCFGTKNNLPNWMSKWSNNIFIFTCEKKNLEPLMSYVARGSNERQLLQMCFISMLRVNDQFP